MKCPSCNKFIWPWQPKSGISSPANVTMHRFCSMDFLDNEPYKTQAEKYKQLLDRKDKGKDISPAEWKNVYGLSK